MMMTTPIPSANGVTYHFPGQLEAVAVVTKWRRRAAAMRVTTFLSRLPQRASFALARSLLTSHVSGFTRDVSG